MEHVTTQRVPYLYLQRHTLFSQSGVHYVILGNRLHPQQDHNERGQEVDMKQSPTEINTILKTKETHFPPSESSMNSYIIEN